MSLMRLPVQCSRTYTYSDLGPTGFVDPVHVFAELRSVAISVPVILCHKQESMNHFMEKGLWQPGKNKLIKNMKIVLFYKDYKL